MYVDTYAKGNDNGRDNSARGDYSGREATTKHKSRKYNLLFHVLSLSCSQDASRLFVFPSPTAPLSLHLSFSLWVHVCIALSLAPSLPRTLALFLSASTSAAW